jgi:adenylate cyclase class IV
MLRYNKCELSFTLVKRVEIEQNINEKTHNKCEQNIMVDIYFSHQTT